MSFPKILAFTAVTLFAAIAVMAWWKSDDKPVAKVAAAPVRAPTEVDLDRQVVTEPKVAVTKKKILPEQRVLPQADRIDGLFTIGGRQLPIVETVTYSSKVSWLKGKPAWISDYASHFKTSKHFIARSLNGRPDYEAQKVANGDHFNVLRSDKNFSFYLVIDTGRKKMWFYYLDNDARERLLLKTYDVGLGRPNDTMVSGTLTPLGKYALSDRIATYKPGVTGTFRGQKTEMIRVFGTRWIPFDKELANCTAPAKGMGIHGAPWKNDPITGKLVADYESIGKNESDGCIRMKTEDMEELFAIIISRPTTVEIVRDFFDADLPGVEVNLDK